jgi:hypothetical protein
VASAVEFCVSISIIQRIKFFYKIRWKFSDFQAREIKIKTGMGGKVNAATLGLLSF